MKIIKHIKRITLLVLYTNLGVIAAGNDREYWSHFEIGNRINDRFSYRVAPELRFKNNFSDHYYTHLEFMLDWNTTKWLTLSPSYRHVLTLTGMSWQTEPRPQMDITLKLKILSMDLSDRNRMEYRMKETGESFRYRNKLTLKLPKFGAPGFQSFMANEIFYDFDVNDLNKNRVYAGCEFTLMKSLKGSIQYLLESSYKNGTWNHVDVIGTNLRYNF